MKMGMQAIFTEETLWKGTIQLLVFDEFGKPIKADIVHNQITNAGKNMLRSVISGNTTDGMLRYVALGTDNGTILPLALTNTQLGNEQFRKVVTSVTDSGTAGLVNSVCYYSSTDANAFTTQEIGWFASPTATATANSGIMLARIFYTLAKTNLQSLQVTRSDQIG